MFKKNVFHILSKYPCILTSTYKKTHTCSITRNRCYHGTFRSKHLLSFVSTSSPSAIKLLQSDRGSATTGRTRPVHTRFLPRERVVTKSRPIYQTDALLTSRWSHRLSNKACEGSLLKAGTLWYWQQCTHNLGKMPSSVLQLFIVSDENKQHDANLCKDKSGRDTATGGITIFGWHLKKGHHFRVNTVTAHLETADVLWRRLTEVRTADTKLIGTQTLLFLQSPDGICNWGGE